MKKGLLEFGDKPLEAEIEKFLPLFPSALPEEYINFITNYDGATGDLPVQPYYFQFWRIKEILENNQGYEIQENLPNYFGIGGNGGGEFFAINLKNKKIFTIPFVPMQETDALLVARSFKEFEIMLGLSEDKYL